jgi:hypothetical protein
MFSSRRAAVSQDELASAQNLRSVMRGLDPRIHLLLLTKKDGLHRNSGLPELRTKHRNSGLPELRTKRRKSGKPDLRCHKRVHAHLPTRYARQ